MDCESQNQIVRTPGTTIISPNFPRNYPNNTECQLIIMFDMGQRVGITFDLFDIEDAGHDCLWLRDGNGSYSSVIGEKYCGGRNLTGFYESKETSMTLNFKSDSSETKSGFKLSTYGIGTQYVQKLFPMIMD